MKLIKRTYLYTLYWLIPAIILGSFFCFYMIEYVAHEETDEFLTYEMHRLTRFYDENNSLPEFHKVDTIYIGSEMKNHVFKDTLLLETGDNEMVPYRELSFSIFNQGEHKIVVLRHLLLGSDDILEGTLLIVIGLVSVFALFLALILRFVAKRIWKPFYETLNKLMNFNIQQDVPIFPKTIIEEFNQLNETMDTILKRVSNDFKNKKEFTENIAHELQTHLAIIRLNTESLLNKVERFDEEDSKSVKKIYDSSGNLMRIQRSLFLLSKIANGEFTTLVALDIEHTILKTLDLFEELIKQRSIELSVETTSTSVMMETGLADVLINNLIKNAIKHNIHGGFITVELTNDKLIVRNSGRVQDKNPEELIRRFEKGKTGSTGLGLAIVQQICDCYQFQLSYTISEKLIHELKISFN